MIKENIIEKKLRAKKILVLLKKNYPDVPELFLDYTTNAQMLCSIILSAQSTDAQINKITEKLFKKYRTVNDFASAKKSVFEKEIFSAGYYRQKTKNIILCFKKIESDFGGKVPSSMEELVSLPGVGRKTANLVLLSKGNISGIAVDTHVFRLSKRIGFSMAKNPLNAEKDLIECFDKKEWANINRLFISHGRAVCTAKKAFCSKCFLDKKKLCPKIGVHNKQC